MNQTQPLEIKLPAADQERLALGVELYAKHLERVATDNERMGRVTEAQRDRNEAETLRNELVAPVTSGEGELVLYPRHLAACRRGLEYYATNLKAAKGTMSPLGSWYKDVVEQLENDAVWIQTAILPDFEEQRSLQMGAAPAETSTSGAEPGLTQQGPPIEPGSGVAK